MRNIDITPSTNMVVGLTAGNYPNSYAALCEFIDNSTEDEVCATFCEISYDLTYFKENEKQKRKIEKIYIADDGLSMDTIVADKYFKLGESIKKIFAKGKYGWGGKTGGLSIGYVIELYTKTIDGKIEKRIYDKELIQSGKKFDVNGFDEEELTKNEIDMFYSKIKNHEHGTLVVISNIYRLSSYDYQQFTESMIKQVAETYSLLLSSKKIIVNNKEVKPINYFGGTTRDGDKFTATLLEEVNAEINGKKVRIEYYDCYGDTKDSGELITSASYDIPLNGKNAGGYFFRNGRLTGLGVNVSDFFEPAGDGHSVSFRYAVYYDGSLDDEINSSFNKSVRGDDCFNEDFKKLLIETGSDWAKKTVNEFKIKRKKNSKEDDIEGINRTKGLKEVLSKIPQKLLSDVHKNKHRENKDDDTKEKTDKTLNTNGVKKRDSKEFRTERLNNNFISKVTIDTTSAKDDAIYYTVKDDNGKWELRLNRNHPFYEKVYLNIPDSIRNLLILLFIGNDLSIKGNDKLDVFEKQKLLEADSVINTYKNELLYNLFKTYDNSTITTNLLSEIKRNYEERSVITIVN